MFIIQRSLMNPTLLINPMSYPFVMPYDLRHWQFSAMINSMWCVSLQTVATVTVVSVSVMKAGLEMPASSRNSVTSPTRRAKSYAKTHRGWCAPTEVPPSLYIPHTYTFTQCPLSNINNNVTPTH